MMKIADIYNKHVSWIGIENDGTTKYCPPQDLSAKSLHPRVALKFANNQASCPYCGLKFKLKARE